MERLIREFGAWLKQGFGWLVDVIVFGCLWGISQVSRLLNTHFSSAPILKIVCLFSCSCSSCMRSIGCSAASSE